MGENEEFDTGVEIETPETSTVETPPTPEPEPEKPDAEEERRKLIAEKAFKQRAAERRAEEAERKLQELEAKLNRQERPAVPDPADPLRMSDQEWQEHVRQRDMAIQRQAEWDAKQRLNEEQQRITQAAKERQQQEAIAKSVEEYSGRAVKLGMKPEELQQAGDRVHKFGLAMPLVELILKDEQGPLITKYLAQNVDELEELTALSPLEAGIRIATVVKAKAAALKPKVSTAPNPTTQVRGGTISTADYGPEGATYE